MWMNARLSFSDEINSLKCSVISAHPWVYGLGNETENGFYLSPSNAISFLANKLASVGEVSDVVIFLIDGSGNNEFIQALDEFADVLPLSAITQIRRISQSASELATEKMLIPSSSVSLPAAVPFSTPTTRAALNAKIVAEAQRAASDGFSMGEMKNALTEFAQKRNKLLSEIAEGMASIKTKSARAWVFTSQGDVATTLYHLVKDIPAASAVHCAAVMLLGTDLSDIRGMIHELNPDTGA